MALLELLKAVLPKAALDPAVAEKIYAAVENELMQKSRAMAFDKYCERMELPDLEAGTLAEQRRSEIEAALVADCDCSFAIALINGSGPPP